MTDSAPDMLAGLYTATPVRCVRYGPDSINDLKSIIEQVLPKDTDPKVLIVTGKSLAKTPVIPQIEGILGDAHAATYTKMRQHTPVDDVEEALKLIQEKGVNILLAVGGGSPIDACKAISFHSNERHGHFMPHIAVPTTLSAAEFTQIAGQTNKSGKKDTLMHEKICPSAVILDAKLAMYTPEQLWLSTGIRALDHALEGLYRPKAQYPFQQMQLAAIRDTFTYLPRCKGAEGKDLEWRQKLQVAAWMSLFPARLDTALGPSHVLGHGLGATYSIPHGTCSVLTLGATVRLMSRTLPEGSARSTLANTFAYLPTPYVRDHYTNSDADNPEVSACLATASAVDKLIDQLGLKTSLSEWKVPKEDLPKLAKAAYEAVSAKPGWKEVCPAEDKLLTEVLEKIY